MKHLLGIDIGGTKISVVLADENGNFIDQRRFPTLSERGPRVIVDEILEKGRSLIEVHGAEVGGVGVSFGGPFDPEKGILESPANLPGWKGFPLREAFQEAFPDIPVVVENDANAAALAEWHFGVGRGYHHLLYVTMGTGIGAGLIIDGRLLRGADHLAGEIGHMCLFPHGPLCGCGRRGCLEALCSGPAIARRAREKLQAGVEAGDLLDSVSLENLRTEDLLSAARRGNAFALEHFRETAYFLGWGLSLAVNLLNPQLIIVGTVATAAGELFFRPLREYVRLFAMKRLAESVRIVPAGLGDRVGDYAALALLRR